MIRCPVLETILAELSSLVGGRLQRVDVPDERELVLEFRLPGRTLSVLACVRSEDARIHMVQRRPARKISAGPLQRFLRQHLVGQKLADLLHERHTVSFVLEKHTLALDLRGGKRALRVTPEGVQAPQAVPGHELPDFEANRAAEIYYGTSAEEAADDRQRRYLAQGLKSEKKKLLKLQKNLEKDAERFGHYEQAGHHGELLKSVLGKVRRGEAEFVAYDWSLNREVTAPLDPRLSPKANLQKMFDRAKKAHRGRPMVEAKLGRVEDRLLEIEIQLLEIKEASRAQLQMWVDASSASFEGLRPIIVKKHHPTGSKKPIELVARRFVAVDGTEIWVGKGAANNDRLTFSFAKGDDIWIHARGSSGAHVIVRTETGKYPSPEVVLDAAHLAVHHSSQQKEHKAEVMIAEVRHVKKTKGVAPGRVGVSASRTMLVRMESERLDRLYARFSSGR
ncbi:MAG: DUF814 domain-containing protein [Myxococcales bacterium]|nr:DUF814 domain-containing protein [Myxococcales bacterium]